MATITITIKNTELVNTRKALERRISVDTSATGSDSVAIELLLKHFIKSLRFEHDLAEAQKNVTIKSDAELFA